MKRLNAALADRYRIERELGAGGMATIYLAEDLRHDRRVALKVLKPELTAVLGADRFIQEIKTTAQRSGRGLHSQLSGTPGRDCRVRGRRSHAAMVAGW